MKKLLLCLTCLFMAVITNAQDIQFETSHVNLESLGASKMTIGWDIQPTGVTMEYKQKSVIKAMQKMGNEPTQAYNLPLKDIQKNGTLTVYTFQDEVMRIMVQHFEGEPNKTSVRINTKDDFTGNVSEQLYFST